MEVIFLSQGSIIQWLYWRPTKFFWISEKSFCTVSCYVISFKTSCAWQNDFLQLHILLISICCLSQGSCRTTISLDQLFTLLIFPSFTCEFLLNVLCRILQFILIFPYFICLTISDSRNIEDNQFSGVIPKQFESIPNLWYVTKVFKSDYLLSTIINHQITN